MFGPLHIHLAYFQLLAFLTHLKETSARRWPLKPLLSSSLLYCKLLKQFLKDLILDFHQNKRCSSALPDTSLNEKYFIVYKESFLNYSVLQSRVSLKKKKKS